jgi:hypothetical protein
MCWQLSRKWWLVFCDQSELLAAIDDGDAPAYYIFSRWYTDVPAVLQMSTVVAAAGAQTAEGTTNLGWKIIVSAEAAITEKGCSDWLGL